MMMHGLSIMAGGAMGAILRYGLIQWTQHILGRGFPYGTLLVNILGAFLLGFVTAYFTQRGLIASPLAKGITVGVLGAFTTFSTFSLETFVLLTQAEWLKAVLNVSLSVGLCLLALAWGMFTARSF